VIGRPDPEWGEHVAAWVVLRSTGDGLTLVEVREHCRDRLARFKAPKELVIVGSIPRTGSGKIRRSALAGMRPGTWPGIGSGMGPGTRIEGLDERRPESGRG
jgi:acyl-CoA synthetase (AMP-forming)/AMP-acid ligase II